MRNMQLNATSLRHPQRASERFASECLEHDAHAALGEHRDILVAAPQDDRTAPASLSTNNGGRCIARMFNIRKMSCQCSSPSADKSPNWGHKRQHKRKAALTRRCSGRRSWYEERSKRETKTRLEARNTKPVDDARLEARNTKAYEAEKWCLRGKRDNRESVPNDPHTRVRRAIASVPPLPRRSTSPRSRSGSWFPPWSPRSPVSPPRSSRASCNAE